MLNQLELALINNDDYSVENIADTIPTSESILKLFLQTKKYDYIRLFIPFVTNSPKSRELVAQIICEELPANKETANALCNAFNIPNNEEYLSFMLGAYGLSNISLSKFIPCPVEYTKGVIAANKPELLTPPFHLSVLEYIGECGAIACMSTLPFNKHTCYFYLKGACKTRNTKTLKFLQGKPEVAIARSSLECTPDDDFWLTIHGIC